MPKLFGSAQSAGNGTLKVALADAMTKRQADGHELSSDKVRLQPRLEGVFLLRP